MKSLASIPRASGLPFVGNLFDIRKDRLELHRRIYAECGDIGAFRMLHVPVVVVSAGELAHEIMVEKADAFIKSVGLRVFTRPLLGNGLLTSEHDVHRRHRKLMSPAFQHRRIASYAEVMVRFTEEMLGRWRQRAIVRIHEEMMALTLAIVAKTLFDADVEGEAERVGKAVEIAMRHTIEEISSLVHFPVAVPTPRNLRLRRAVEELDAIIYRIIAARRASNNDTGDVLSMLLLAEDEEDRSKMSDVEIRDETMTLFLAGHETTANTLTWTFQLLSEHEKARSRLFGEVDRVLAGRSPTFEDVPNLPYAACVVKEAMRLYPPAYSIAREAARDVEIGGHLIPKGTVVIVNVFAMHRRPDVFSNPEAFDPDRFANDAEKKMPRLAYMPFGAGPRICIGNHFAMMEAVLVLAAIANRVSLDLLPGQPVALDPLITLRPKHDFAMRIEARQDSAPRLALR
jgi:cytochrome P450